MCVIHKLKEVTYTLDLCAGPSKGLLEVIHVIVESGGFLGISCHLSSQVLNFAIIFVDGGCAFQAHSVKTLLVLLLLQCERAMKLLQHVIDDFWWSR